MLNFFPKSIKQILTVLVAAVILLVSVWSGIAGGKARAQSSVVLSNAQNLAKGLNFFYGDQERFPSAVEFSSENNRTAMLDYFSQFPPASLAGGQCQQNFAYQRPSASSFKLSFCLPQAFGSFRAGWNQLDQDSNF